MDNQITKKRNIVSRSGSSSKKNKIERTEPIKMIMKRRLKYLEAHGINFFIGRVHNINDNFNNDNHNNDNHNNDNFTSLDITDNDDSIDNDDSSDEYIIDDDYIDDDYEYNHIDDHANDYIYFELKIPLKKYVSESDKNIIRYDKNTFFSYDENMWFSRSPCNITGSLPVSPPKISIKNNIKDDNRYIYLAKPNEKWIQYVLSQSIRHKIQQDNSIEKYYLNKYNNWISRVNNINRIKIKYTSTGNVNIFNELKSYFNLKKIRSISIVKRESIPSEFEEYLD